MNKQDEAAELIVSTLKSIRAIFAVVVIGAVIGGGLWFVSSVHKHVNKPDEWEQKRSQRLDEAFEKLDAERWDRILGQN